MRKTAQFIVLIVALSIAALGLLGGVTGLLFGLLRVQEGQLTVITFSYSLLVLVVGGGSLLAWHTWQAIQGRPSRPFRPRRAWWLIPAFALVLALGQASLSLDLWPLLTFPTLHVAAALLPPLAIVGLVSWRLGGVTRWREMVWQVGSGSLLSTLLAGGLEAVILGSLFMAVILAIAWQPEGMVHLDRMADFMGNAAQSQQEDMIAALARSPSVIMAALLVAAGLIPLLEEGVKTIGVALMGYRRPSMAQALLWGVGGGAGFALAEGLFNSAGALESWGLVALTRSGATLLHCTTGGLMGLAWYFLLVRRRWGRALGLYAASVGFHALWNALTVAIVLLALSTPDQPDINEASQVLTGLGVLGVMTLLGLLVLLVAGILIALTWYVSARLPAAARPKPTDG